MIKRVKNFVFEVRTEMQKVTWPTREELVGSTMVVLATMFLLSAFIGASDLILSTALAVILR